MSILYLDKLIFHSGWPYIRRPCISWPYKRDLLYQAMKSHFEVRQSVADLWTLEHNFRPCFTMPLYRLNRAVMYSCHPSSSPPPPPLPLRPTNFGVLPSPLLCRSARGIYLLLWHDRLPCHDQIGRDTITLEIYYVEQKKRLLTRRQLLTHCWVFSAPQHRGKSRNLALPWHENSVCPIPWWSQLSWGQFSLHKTVALALEAALVSSRQCPIVRHFVS